MSKPAEITAKVLEAQKSFGGPAIMVNTTDSAQSITGSAHSIDVGWTTR